MISRSWLDLDADEVIADEVVHLHWLQLRRDGSELLP